MTFELELIQWLQTFRSTFMDYFFQFWTLFGEELIIIGILGFLYWCYDKKIGESVGITVFLSLVLNSVIKVIVARPRPFLVDDTITNVRPQTSEGFAFPSGHTQGAATTFGSLAIWVKKRWITILSMIIILFVAISRMYLGVHYLTDVIVGAVLGLTIAYGMYLYFKKNQDSTKLYNSILYSSVSVFVGFYIYFVFTAKATIEESNAIILYNNLEGIAKMLGSIVGFVFGIKFEKKYINFSNHRYIGKNLIRFILGVSLVMVVRLLFKAIFSAIVDPAYLLEGELLQSSIAILFDFLRYFVMVFVGIGVYPLLFKKVRL